ncbi:MAG: TonB C-terminal domain-containing protein [Sulfuricellaceae bacterium]
MKHEKQKKCAVVMPQPTPPTSKRLTVLAVVKQFRLAISDFCKSGFCRAVAVYLVTIWARFTTNFPTLLLTLSILVAMLAILIIAAAFGSYYLMDKTVRVDCFSCKGSANPNSERSLKNPKTEMPTVSTPVKSSKLPESPEKPMTHQLFKKMPDPNMRADIDPKVNADKLNYEEQNRKLEQIQSQLQSQLEDEKRKSIEERNLREQEAEARRAHEEEMRRQLEDEKQREVNRHLLEDEKRQALETLENDEKILREQRAVAEAAAIAADRRREIAGLKNKIAAKIKSLVNNQLCQSLHNPEAEFEVALLHTGILQYPPTLKKSSGSVQCDKAIESAIQRAQPLPLPPDPNLSSDVLDDVRHMIVKF